MGTRSIWQSTDQTHGHGTQHTGAGSRRRVRENTTLGPEPVYASIFPVELPAADPAWIGRGDQHPAEITVHPADTLAAAVRADTQTPAASELEPGDA
jgi:hypothetical protein